MCFLNILGGTTSNKNCARVSVGASSENIESLSTDLLLFKETALSEDIVIQSVDGSLNNSLSSVGNSIQIIESYSTSTENISISKVLGSKITNGELG